ncbi:hydroxyisourate hydrolase [Actinoplanes siamensis]|uniref:5-hydroxyisourate hydrolase n=1 Tax=Actinoplanes siamensis TaxID=1223317 RepID=A0A919N3A0_9ACTN|nr:hydroxyisourate hydrolase [Actinoplanes siamensis]GIF03589.1 5-hydroxyisourate hydrolase [Actinoplanes siamensis]
MPSDDGTAPEAHARISTHILDTATGDPAADVHVRLERRDADGWRTIAEGRTDHDGRLRYRVPMREWQAGGYRLLFYVEPHLGRDCFFPEITVAFHVNDPDRHYHVPLLLSRYGYTTYRGS